MNVASEQLALAHPSGRSRVQLQVATYTDWGFSRLSSVHIRIYQFIVHSLSYCSMTHNLRGWKASPYKLKISQEIWFIVVGKAIFIVVIIIIIIYYGFICHHRSLDHQRHHAHHSYGIIHWFWISLPVCVSLLSMFVTGSQIKAKRSLHLFRHMCVSIRL
jgi:uncharacterized integral membrane protein